MGGFLGFTTDPKSQRVKAKVETKVYNSASVLCTNEIAIAPSPTADATRFTLPARTSPTANTDGRLVSNICGGRVSVQAGDESPLCGVGMSRPVRMKPFSSIATQ